MSPKAHLCTKLTHQRVIEASHQITQIESSTTMKQIRPLTLLLASVSAALPAWAHEGHGMPGFAHWHASDVLGFVAIVGVVAAVIWFKGGK